MAQRESAAAAPDSLSPSAPQDQAPTPRLEGERRHLTVLFCDLADSTAIAARMDPEDWRAAIAAYHRAAAEAITLYGGHVAKYLGDGVMAFFGYPEAHDNDAERAVRAGLAILDALAKLNTSGAAHPSLTARVGMDSGAVVVGAGAGSEADVFGDAPNIAARVQAAADPGTVLVSENSYRLIAGLFVTEERGPQTLKGIAHPLPLYRVIGPSGARGRVEAMAASRGLTEFVGRDDELRTLAHRWERACEGEGQVALIIGEAGIGKSRLLHRFRESITVTPHKWIDAAAGAFYQNTPFYPVTEILRQMVLGQSLDRLDHYLRELQKPESPGAPSGDQFGQLLVGLKMAGLQPDQTIPLVAPLLNLPVPANFPPSNLLPEQKRRRLLATLVDWILGSARQQPLIIATEDLHWADPSTLELIQLLVEQGNAAPLMLLYTARPEFRPPWPSRSHHAQINLNRLNARDVRAIVAQVAAHKALSDETVAAVVERTGGVPLFVEELTRALIERGDARPAGREIPATLHDSLIARLDRLGPARETLQLGAVLGGDFSYELLHAVHPSNDEHEIQRHLRTLTDADLLYVRGVAPDAAYQFKHALIRDAAYEALLKSRRKELHLRVARTIDSHFPAVKENHPEVLARHWTEAGELEPAIAEWTRAGKSAESRNAFKEALDNYQQAIACLQLMAESPQRNNQQLELHQSVVWMLYHTGGYSTPETVEAIDRASALAEKIGSLTELGDWVRERCLITWLSGDLPAASNLADRGLDLALRDGIPASLAGGHNLQQIARLWRGDLAGAEEHFTNGLEFFDDPEWARFPAAVVSAFAYGSWSAWMQGRAESARRRMLQMTARVNSNNPYELASAGFHGAFLYLLMREYDQAEDQAARTLELSEKHRFPIWSAVSICALGQAQAQLGNAPGGIALIRQAMADRHDLGQRARSASWLTFLAAAQQQGGYAVDALQTVEYALDVDPEELLYRPETLRLRGEIQLKLGHSRLAETDFREAIALAQSMSAKAWELRATISLARLLASTHRRAEAYTMLSTIYNWFTEGFDTADLKDAKSLLDDLST